MTSRADAADRIRSRIAGTLADAAAGHGPETPPSVVTGSATPATIVAESATDTTAASPLESGVRTPETTLPIVPAVPSAAAELPVAPPLAGPVTTQPTTSTPSRAWEKLSITLNRSDFQILESQTARARAAGIRMRRGGNPSVFLRAALRNLEALRITNPTAWLELVRAAASSERS